MKIGIRSYLVKQKYFGNSITFLMILSQIIVNSDTIFFQYFVNKNMNYARQLFNFDGSLKSWELLKQENVLDKKYRFK